MFDFYSKEHKDEIKKLEGLWSNLKALESMCHDYGIDDLFQDNGAKVLQQLVYLNLDVLAGREGNDAVSASGTEWEMKSINVSTSATGFSTNHHVNDHIISKYRLVPWSFAIYNNIDLVSIYVMKPSDLEPFFEKWESQYHSTGKELNNPKIPVSFVKEKGLKVYPYLANPVDPDSINI